MPVNMSARITAIASPSAKPAIWSPTGNFASSAPTKSSVSRRRQDREHREREPAELGQDVVVPLERPRQVQRHHAVAQVAGHRVGRAARDEQRDDQLQCR